MDSGGAEKSPFDENAALQELERFREEIERYKLEREALGDRFEQFVRSFRTPPAPREAEARPALVRAPERVPASAPTTQAPAPPSPEPRAPSPELRAPAPSATAPAPRPDLPAAASAEPGAQPPARRRSTHRTGLLIGGALILMSASGYVTWTLRKSAAPSSPAAPVAPPTPATGPSRAGEAPAPVTPAPSAIQRSPFQSEITTTRAVWVRVIADGERVLERELPPNARVPFTARKTIVIRTGDAGAVRLSIGGREPGALGREGEVVTRTFTVPGR